MPDQTPEAPAEVLMPEPRQPLEVAPAASEQQRVGDAAGGVILEGAGVEVAVQGEGLISVASRLERVSGDGHSAAHWNTDLGLFGVYNIRPAEGDPGAERLRNASGDSSLLAARTVDENMKALCADRDITSMSPEHVLAMLEDSIRMADNAVRANNGNDGIACTAGVRYSYDGQDGGYRAGDYLVFVGAGDFSLDVCITDPEADTQEERYMNLFSGGRRPTFAGVTGGSQEGDVLDGAETCIEPLGNNEAVVVRSNNLKGSAHQSLGRWEIGPAIEQLKEHGEPDADAIADAILRLSRRFDAVNAVPSDVSAEDIVTGLMQKGDIRDKTILVVTPCIAQETEPSKE